METITSRTGTSAPGVLARHLAGVRYMNLTTFRKSGAALPTPVWFALADDRAYVVTVPTAGKVKRIRNNGRVCLAPSDWRSRVKGGEIDATATIAGDPAERAIAERTLAARYGWQWRLFAWFGERRARRSGTPNQRAYLAIGAV